jgi:hypothetical protein
MYKNQLNEIYTEAKLSEEDVRMMPAYLEDRVEFYGTPAFAKLYEYFAFETCEMPYGAQKARTETPDEWIIDYLEGLA